MAKGNEGKLIDKVHRQLTIDVYRMKMNMGLGAPAGVADMFYEGTKNDLFVEYKYIDDWEKKRSVPMNQLTANQVNWISRRIKNGRPIGLIMGDKNGMIFWIDECNWKDPIKPLYDDLWTPRQAARHIRRLVMS